ncbi:NnrU family protein [Roseicitreum antarcticum]|uniref:NnrU protein n=1 Tax=Roseicitreum antarcticum TaxID=564137 RepID=A0A1H2XE03_9RHOB|nr:NnrU family protein [Roseicitreum antarcticum]SDW90986.1 NnrU protein [Roseicitreum antarcticum]
MGLAILILGVALWAIPHLFKRLAPAPRARMGDTARGVVTATTVASIIAMVVGYKMADIVPLYFPAPWLSHVNNLLVLIAFYIFAIPMARGALSQKYRHPMLTGFALWAVAHLLVRGDLASVIMFGGLALWAVVSILMINAQVPTWSPKPAKGGTKRDLVAIPIVLVTYLIVGLVHGWIGPSPFGA